jgi:microcystin-dependent protein
MEPFVGEIKLFTGDYPPKGYMFCNGQELPVSQFPELFAVINNIYGGDGKRTFFLPNLCSRLPMHVNNDDISGRSKRPLATTGGITSVILTKSHVPAHQHPIIGSSKDTDVNIPAANTVPGVAPGPRGQKGPPVYVTTGVEARPLNPLSLLDFTGGNKPVDMTQPFLGLNFIIATTRNTAG